MARLEQLGHRLEHDLVAALEDAGWDVGPQSQTSPEGLVATHRNESFVLRLEVAPLPTRSFIEAMLSRAVLEAKASSRALGMRPLAVVGAASVSSRMTDALRAFAKRCLDDETAYGWIDTRGRLELHGSSRLEAVTTVVSRPGPPRSRRLSGKNTIFSDLGQWLMKVLLAPKLPPSLLSAPRERPRNVRHLAHIAEVSEATAHRVMSAAKEAGLIHETDGILSIVDPAYLLERWQRTVAMPRISASATWILNKRDSQAALDHALAKKTRLDARQRPTACLGAFAAAERLGLGHVRGVCPHLLLRDASLRSLDALGLRETEPGEPTDVFVVRPPYPESTFRGSVSHGGIWTTDVLQTWIDVSYHPARGEEQAEVILRHLSSPERLGLET